MGNRGYNCYVAPTFLGTWVALVPLDSRRCYAAKSLLHCSCPLTKSCLTLGDPHGLQHTRLPCFSPSPRVCAGSCPLHQRFHPAISSRVTLFFCTQSFPTSGSFPMNHSSHHVAKVLQLQSSSEYSGFISFKIDWFDLLAVQETLKSLLQHHSSKAPIIWCSAIFRI